jgi:hypothetical protein
MAADQISPLPLPWHIGPHYRFDVESAHGRVASGCPEFSPQSEANAEYIVTACNAYPDLLAALKSCVDECERLCVGNVDLMRAAIAKAEGTTHGR